MSFFKRCNELLRPEKYRIFGDMLNEGDLEGLLAQYEVRRAIICFYDAAFNVTFDEVDRIYRANTSLSIKEEGLEEYRKASIQFLLLKYRHIADSLLRGEVVFELSKLSDELRISPGVEEFTCEDFDTIKSHLGCIEPENRVPMYMIPEGLSDKTILEFIRERERKREIESGKRAIPVITGKMIHKGLITNRWFHFADIFILQLLFANELKSKNKSRFNLTYEQLQRLVFPEFDYPGNHIGKTILPLFKETCGNNFHNNLRCYVSSSLKKV